MVSSIDKRGFNWDTGEMDSHGNLNGACQIWQAFFAKLHKQIDGQPHDDQIFGL